MIKRLWARYGFVRRIYDDKTNSTVVLLWRGRFVTGWGRPASNRTGRKAPVNRVLFFGVPLVKTLGKWEWLRPGQPTRAQIAGSVLSRVRGIRDVLDYLLGDKDPPRGWGKTRISKKQRILLRRIRKEVTAIWSDVEYLAPQKKREKKDGDEQAHTS